MIRWRSHDGEFNGFIEKKLCFVVSPSQITDNQINLYLIRWRGMGYVRTLLSKHATEKEAKKRAKELLLEAISTVNPLTALGQWVDRKEEAKPPVSRNEVKISEITNSDNLLYDGDDTNCSFTSIKEMKEEEEREEEEQRELRAMRATREANRLTWRKEMESIRVIDSNGSSSIRITDPTGTKTVKSSLSGLPQRNILG